MFAHVIVWLWHHPLVALGLAVVLYAGWRRLSGPVYGEGAVITRDSPLGAVALAAAAVIVAVLVTRHHKTAPPAAHPAPVVTHTTVTHVTRVVHLAGTVSAVAHAWMWVAIAVAVCCLAAWAVWVSRRSQ